MNRTRIILALTVIAIVLCGCGCCRGWYMEQVPLDYMWTNVFIPDNVAALRKLADDGLPLNNIYDGKGNSPDVRSRVGMPLLAAALQHNATNCAAFLLDRKVDVSKKCANGSTVLMFCVSLPGEAALIWSENLAGLCPPSYCDMTNHWGYNPLSSAIRRDRSELIEFYLSRGADVNRKQIEPRQVEPCPYPFYALDKSIETFNLIMTNQNTVVRGLKYRGDSLITGLSPELEDYEMRVKCLLGRLVDINDADSNVLIKNMESLGDCGDRVKWLCGVGVSGKKKNEALGYAKQHGLAECAKVLSVCIGSI